MNLLKAVLIDVGTNIALNSVRFWSLSQFKLKILMLFMLVSRSLELNTMKKKPASSKGSVLSGLEEVKFIEESRVAMEPHTNLCKNRH